MVFGEFKEAIYKALQITTRETDWDWDGDVPEPQLPVHFYQAQFMSVK